jgi:hypothetical protein
MKESVRYVLCLDTDKYAGNFERETCAYCTGQTGECGKGEKEAKEFYFDMEGHEEMEQVVSEVGEIILQVPDEHGTLRPCYIWPTPGWFNNGMGTHTRISEPGEIAWPAYNSVAIFFEEMPSEELLELIIGRAEEYLPKHKITLEGVRLLTETTVVTTTTRRIAAGGYGLIHKFEGQWWFWDETLANRMGPYDDKPAATKAWRGYCKSVLG